MKGIVHFSTGVAAASCFPSAVEAAAHGNPWYFVLGGFAGLLPDTLDFKLIRFLYPHDTTITPDPIAFDAQVVADGVDQTIRQALHTGRPVSMKLNTVKTGLDRWRRYEVVFDVARRKIVVEAGPIVDTGGNPVALDEHWITRERGEATMAGELKLDYLARLKVDVFDGPSFRMDPVGPDSVLPRMIPWHRAWTHSLVTSGAVAACLGWMTNSVAGTIFFLGVALHALCDQLGYMGSNFFYPFQRHRSEGMHTMHSSDVGPNVWTLWFECALIYWNLSRTAMTRPGDVVDMIRFILLTAVVPLVVTFLARRVRARHL